MTVSDTVRKMLFDMQDNDYKAFQAKLMPTVDPDAIIGVRTPALRKLAKEAAKMDGYINEYHAIQIS